MKTAIMTLPVCPNCKTQMHMRANPSKDAKFCGVWYDCAEPGCSCSTLLPSKELMAFLATQKHH